MTPARFAVLAGLWDEFSATLSPLEREELAADLSTPPDVLAALAQDSAPAIRESVARNGSTPPEALAELARDTDFEVRERVARNLSTPIDALAGLTRDSNPGVSAAALSALAARQETQR